MARFATAVALSALLVASAFANLSGKSNVVAYWGQDSAGIHFSNQDLWEQPLRFYCTDNTYDVINIAFLNIFFDTTQSQMYPNINLANHCATTFTGSTLLSCPDVGSDIQYCQSQGKLIMLSLGGAAGVYGFSSASQATTFATTVWNMFLNGTNSAYPRPFGSGVVLNGLDFDIEGGSSLYYDTFANALLTLAGSKNKVYLSAAPQCVYPDAYVGPGANTLLSNTKLDWINVQFYNNYCSISGGSNFNFAQWNSWATTAPNTAIKIMLGVPADTYAGADYLSIADITSHLQTTQSTYSNFGGVMLWDAGAAYDNSQYGLAIKNILLASAPPAPTSTSTSAPTSTSASAPTSTSTSPPTSTSTSPPTSPPPPPPTNPPATSPPIPTACTASVNGYICTSQCSTSFYFCLNGYAYPPQALAAGTVCLNGQQVYPSQCSTSTPTTTTGPTSPPTTSAPTTSNTPAATNKPSTSPPPTNAPPTTPNQGSSRPPATCTTSGVNCFPSDCCNQFYLCSGGVSYPLQATSTGTLCKAGQLVFPTDCSGIQCGSNSSVITPPPAAVCGNSICQATETCTSCPADCGQCPATCGDGKCNGAETCATCSADCGVCTPNSAGSGPNPTTPPTAPPTAVPTTANGVTVAPPVAPSASAAAGQMLIGYYTNWAQYRSGSAQFVPENINAKLFTNLVYAFAQVDTSFNVQPYEWNDILDYTAGMYQRFNTTCRTQNPLIKTSISIGGWNFNADSSTSGIFSSMVSTSANRAVFINSAIQFARANGFDGVDIDWEYPGDVAQGGTSTDYAGFANLLKEFRAAISFESYSTGHAPLLLSIAVAAGITNIQNGYNVPAIHPYVDWIGVMTYDLHGSWETVTGAATALYSQTDKLSVDGAISFWLSQGAPSNKLIVGLATYGRSWTLTSASSSGMGASTTGAGPAGPSTLTAGFLAYYEILALISSGGTVHYDAPSHTEYLVQGTTWVSYDNTATLAEKVAYINTKNLAGGMIWALDLDDFNHGYPLVSSVAQAMFVPKSTTASIKLTASAAASLNVNTLAAQIATATGISANSVQVGVVTTNSDGTATVDVYFTNTFTSSQSATQAYSTAVANGCQTPGVESVNGVACTSLATTTPTPSAGASSTMVPSVMVVLIAAFAAQFYF